jgi:hypothetical protein
MRSQELVWYTERMSGKYAGPTALQNSGRSQRLLQTMHSAPNQAFDPVERRGDT